MIDLLKRYPAMVATLGAGLVLLGGSFAIELPADRKVAALEIQVAQRWEAQKRYDRGQELQAIRWRMQYIANEINRIMAIPQYLNRPISPEEQWQVEQLKQEWEYLRQREQELL